jgi:adenosylmethionine-8-amino-7-oxononanoate aminotransferase
MPKHLFHLTQNQSTDNIINQVTSTEFGFIDQNGIEKLDLTQGWFSFPLGFKRQDIIDHVTQSTASLKYDFPDGYISSTARQQLSNKLYDLSNGYRSAFSVSGSDAVETAIYISSMYHNNTDKKIILALELAYHGSTALTRSLGQATEFDQLNPNIVKIPNIDYTRFGDSAGKVFVKLLTHHIRSIGADKISALVLETASWLAKLDTYSIDVWKEIKQLCSDNNILLIVDDIAICGGKTGSFFGIDIAQVQPDLVCIGKGMTGGFFPLSATLLNESVYAKVKELPFMFGYTHSANVSGIESAIKYISILEEEKILENVPVVIEEYQRIFNQFKQQGHIVKYNSIGTMFSLELSKSISTKTLLDCNLFCRPETNNLIVALPINPTTEFFSKLVNSFRMVFETPFDFQP